MTPHGEWSYGPEGGLGPTIYNVAILHLFQGLWRGGPYPRATMPARTG